MIISVIFKAGLGCLFLIKFIDVVFDLNTVFQDKLGIAVCHQDAGALLIGAVVLDRASAEHCPAVCPGIQCQTAAACAGQIVADRTAVHSKA